ncbi:AraC family transcriptional regulator [Aquabacterium sp. J223]|uniref:AraC family transcriptional regulator n=1 Tax=Aquabacterium sp. J223 TaxID=2898431 RepID=UPI0021AD61BD|nr:AraC family transcriptional regulator [Aquabacterium sp. J223]UUX95241.1 AraC family transcriptional regulator [Aquabacterium sp. J223]
MVFKPWLNDKIYAPYKVSALVETLLGLGVPAVETLKGTGLSAQDLEDAQTLTSVGQYLTACRNAVRLVPDPITPFLLGRKMHLSAYGMYGYALMCSVTLRNFFDDGVKYHHLATPTVVIEWREEAGAAIWSFPRLTSPELSADLHRFLIELQLMLHAVHLKDVAGPACTPLKATLSYPQPPHADHYARFLECPVSFNAPACELHFDAAILDKPTQLAHKLTSTLMQATCERLIGQAKISAGASGEVYQILMATPGRLPALGEVAAMVHMHERTLRRKLESEGTSFGEIVDDVRASLAIEYLRTTKMKTDDIAALVGFSDAANFRRAFKRWTGKAPSDFKR